MLPDSFYKELSRGNWLTVPEGVKPVFPIRNMPRYVTKTFNPDPSCITNYDEVVIIPEKINHSIWIDKDTHHVGYVEEAKNKIRRQMSMDIYKLEAAGIPVFLHDSTNYPETVDTFREVMVTSCYSIPKELMYRSFFVLHEITHGVKHASEYAMQQVQKVIDKY